MVIYFSGPTLFMVLSREDAVDGWRSLMGTTDPSQAKEQDPESYVNYVLVNNYIQKFKNKIKMKRFHWSMTSKIAYRMFLWSSNPSDIKILT